MSISRLINEGLAIREGNKIWYSDPIMQNQKAILKDLEGKSIEELKNLIVVLKSYLGLVKNYKVVKNKLLMII